MGQLVIRYRKEDGKEGFHEKHLPISLTQKDRQAFLKLEVIEIVLDGNRFIKHTSRKQTTSTASKDDCKNE